MIWNPLDPLGSLSRALQNGYAQIVELFQRFIAVRLTLDGTPFVQYLYGNALGAYNYVAMAVMAVTFIIALFIKRGRASFAQAAIVVVAAGVIGPLWFYAADQFQLLGDQLTITFNLNQKVEGVDGVNLVTLAFPQLEIPDVLMSLFTFAPLMYFMYSLFSVFVSYAFITVVVKFLGLLCFALLALGTRSQKVFSLLIAIGLVAVVLGRAVAVLFISIGQGLSSITAVFAEGFIQGIILNGSVIAAILVQPVLIFLMYKGVSPIVGRVAAAVTGKVRALSENREGQSVRGLSNANAASLQGRSEAIPYNKGPSYARRAVEIGGAMAIAKGAAMLAAKAASAVPHPAVKIAAVVATVGLKALPKRTSGTPRR
ncbi:MAG TPA: hypothetical protein VIM31_01470 [Candidatus Microsaccharimonas sp.]